MSIRTFKNSCLLFLFLSLYSPTIFACDCIAQPELQIEDWNDAPIIFTATLTAHKKTMQFGFFTFSLLEKYKGDIPEEVTIYFQPQKSHTLLHAVKDFSIGKEWIVFANEEVIKGKKHYRLRITYGSEYCGLSRPVDPEKESDRYLSFLENMEKSAKRFRKFRNKDNIVIAAGKYRKKRPHGKWTYFKEDGKLALSGKYKKGNKVGLWLKYATDKDQQQIIIQQKYYDKGTLVKKVNYTFYGELRSEELFTENNKIFLQYRKGQLISKQVKTLDNKTLSRFKYRDGVLIKEEHFRRDGGRILRRG